jgi:hypothetical protein
MEENVEIIDVLGDGDCFYRAIYGYCLVNDLLDSILFPCFNFNIDHNNRSFVERKKLKNNLEEDTWILNIRKYISNSILSDHRCRLQVEKTYNYLINLDIENDDIIYYSLIENTFPSWFVKKFPNLTTIKRTSKDDFINFIADSIKIKGNWAFQLDYDLVNILLKPCCLEIKTLIDIPNTIKKPIIKYDCFEEKSRSSSSPKKSSSKKSSSKKSNTVSNWEKFDDNDSLLIYSLTKSKTPKKSNTVSNWEKFDDDSLLIYSPTKSKTPKRSNSSPKKSNTESNWEKFDDDDSLLIYSPDSESISIFPERDYKKFKIDEYIKPLDDNIATLPPRKNIITPIIPKRGIITSIPQQNMPVLPPKKGVQLPPKKNNGVIIVGGKHVNYIYLINTTDDNGKVNHFKFLYWNDNKSGGNYRKNKKIFFQGKIRRKYYDNVKKCYYVIINNNKTYLKSK